MLGTRTAGRGEPATAGVVRHQQSTLSSLDPPKEFERYHEAMLAFANGVVGMVEEAEAGNRNAFNDQAERLNVLTRDVQDAYDALNAEQLDSFIEHECWVPGAPSV